MCPFATIGWTVRSIRAHGTDLFGRLREVERHGPVRVRKRESRRDGSADRLFAPGGNLELRVVPKIGNARGPILRETQGNTGRGRLRIPLHPDICTRGSGQGHNQDDDGHDDVTHGTTLPIIRH